MRLALVGFFWMVASSVWAADVQCQDADNWLSFSFTGTEGTGPAILRFGDNRLPIECSRFECATNWGDSGRFVGLTLDLAPSPDQIILAIVGVDGPLSPSFRVFIREVECSVSN